MTRIPLALLPVAAFAVLAACAPAAQAPRPVGAPATAPPEARFIAAMEAEGCVLTGANSAAVLLRANLTEAELPAIVASLEAQNRIESPAPATLRIVSGRCA